MHEEIRCPGELAGLAAVRGDLERQVPEGYTAIGTEEYDYLTDLTPVSSAEVGRIVLPAPEQKEEAAAAGYESEESRTLVVLPAALYEQLVAASYPELAEAQGFVKPPPYSWLPSPNYTPARRNASNVYYHIVHTTEGPYWGSISWLRDRRSYASTHAIMDAAGKHSAVLVSDEDIAWTAGHSHYNRYGLQLEQEGYAARGGFSEAFYKLSAHWAAHHLTKFKIPLRLGFDPDKSYSAQKGGAYRAGIIGHHHVPYPSTHTDPGPHFDWEKLLFYTKRVIRGEEKEPPRPKEPKPEKLWRVQVGAFDSRKNAERLARRLKDDGFEVYVLKDGLWRVQVGAFSRRENAEEMARRLQRAGYPYYIRHA